MTGELSPIEKAIRSIGGNKSELARLVGCSPSNITNIIARGGKIPCKNKKIRNRWIRVTGLSKKELFPQLY